MCRGLAFEFPHAMRTQVLDYLAQREGDAFKLCERSVMLENHSEVVTAFVPLYTGRNVIEGKTLDEIASMVTEASGTEGTCLA